jgi:hypothetical protein
MKMRVLVAAVASTFMAISMAHADAASVDGMADDSGTSMQQSAPNTTENVGGMQNATGASSDQAVGSTDNSATTDATTASNGNDDMSADTATGDDDY